MSQEEGQAVPVADVAPGDGAPMRITATGNLRTPVLITPVGAGTASFQGFLVFQEAAKKDEEVQDPLAERKKWFEEMRGWLMLLATVGASVAYQAGLNPPGGFWQDNNRDHHAGDPVLHDQHWVRYIMFYYFNATAFVTSLFIMVLLMSSRFYLEETKVVALMFATIADLASLVGAYIAGTTRSASSCVYIVVITCVSFVCLIYSGEAMGGICAFVLRRIRCMRDLAKLKWCRGAADVVTKSLPEEERKKRAKRSRRPCCPCCGPSTPSPADRCDVEGQ